MSTRSLRPRSRWRGSGRPRPGGLIGIALFALSPGRRGHRHHAGTAEETSATTCETAFGAGCVVPVDSAPLPTVPVAWEQLDFGAMPADVAQDLESGKLLLRQALSRQSGSGNRLLEAGIGSSRELTPSACRTLSSPPRERASQFGSDSGDVIILLKQGKRDLAWSCWRRCGLTSLTLPPLSTAGRQ